MNRDQVKGKLKQYAGSVQQDAGKLAGNSSKTIPTQWVQWGQKTKQAQQVFQDQQAQQAQDSEGLSQQP